MSDFDPSTLLDQEMNEASATKYLNPDEGTYNAMIDNLEMVSGESDKGPWYAADLTCKLTCSAGRLSKFPDETATVRTRLFLDVADGQIATGDGKNVQLGKIRTATDLNDPGQAFSLNMLIGRNVNVQIKNRINGDDINSNISRGLPYGDIEE